MGTFLSGKGCPGQAQLPREAEESPSLGGQKSHMGLALGDTGQSWHWHCWLEQLDSMILRSFFRLNVLSHLIDPSGTQVLPCRGWWLHERGIRGIESWCAPGSSVKDKRLMLRHPALFQSSFILKVAITQFKPFMPWFDSC